MACIAIIDPIPGSAVALATALRERRHRVTVHSTNGSIDEQALGDAEVVIVNVTRPPLSDLTLLKDICRWRSPESLRPIVFAISAVFRGPQFRLEAQQAGCCFLYLYE